MVVSFSSRVFWTFPGAGLLTVTGLPTSLHSVLVTIYLVMVSMVCLVTESGYRFLSHSSLSGGCPSVAICWEDRESDNTAKVPYNGTYGMEPKQLYWLSKGHSDLHYRDDA